MRRVISASAAAAALALTAVAVPALAASSKRVAVGDLFFRPGHLTVSRGTKVSWKWNGGSGIPHNVTVRSGPARFHSRTMSSGSYSHTFSRAGTYHLYCTVHPSQMQETVVVR